MSSCPRLRRRRQTKKRVMTLVILQSKIARQEPCWSRQARQTLQWRWTQPCPRLVPNRPMLQRGKWAILNTAGLAHEQGRGVLRVAVLFESLQESHRRRRTRYSLHSLTQLYLPTSLPGCTFVSCSLISGCASSFACRCWWGSRWCTPSSWTLLQSVAYSDQMSHGASFSSTTSL